MTTATSPVAIPKLDDLGASRTDKVQTVAYVVAATQVAAGIMSAIYVLITQAIYFGHSLKGSWDSLDLLWHFGAVPQVGGWLVANYDVGRHVFLRDAPISVLAFALVAMLVPKLTPMRDKVPPLDRVLIFLRMPSRYQERPGYARLRMPWRKPRVHHRTSPLQFVFLLPSMLFIALPGEIISGAVIFGGMWLAHRNGYALGVTADAAWIPIVVGVCGGILAGHKPAVKAGDDVQRFFLGKRLAVAYAADAMLDRLARGEVSQTDVRDKLTAMPAARPTRVYAPSYVKRYDVLLDARAPVRRYSWLSRWSIRLMAAGVLVLAVYGLYIRWYGIKHGFWMP